MTSTERPSLSALCGGKAAVPAHQMAIKESSDERNPTAPVADSSLSRTTPARTPKDYLALAIATCGVGYLPLAPGTWGSLVGIGVYAVVRGIGLKLMFDLAAARNLTLLHVYSVTLILELLAAIVITFIGIWAASRTEKLAGRKDPSKVVIDEVAGQFIALLPVPFLINEAWWAAILAFVFFRFFDIVKPYPARKFESLESGLGIMADDIVAGIYAAIVVAIAVTISWLF
jgi:phosphatidylglycerophosphatase A